MKTKIQDAIKAAMKSKDKVRLDTTRLLLSAIQYEEMQKKVDSLPEPAAVAVLQREIGRHKEELEYAEKANRPEQIEKLAMQMKIIEEFLPKQLSSEELEKIISGIKTSDPASNMGLVMKNLKENYAGQYDGATASQIAKKVFG